MRATKIKNANVFLSTWIVITLAITFIDLAIFILFTIDYANLVERSRNVELPMSGNIPAASTTWLSAQNSAGIMMTISLRGYFLWVVNLILAVYFFLETFSIYNFNRRKVTSVNECRNICFIKSPMDFSEAAKTKWSLK